MSADNLDDPDFILLLRAQDHAAFTRLVRARQRGLCGFAATFVGRDQAEDIMQEAWVAVFRGLPGFEARASLSTWLHTIVRHTCVARLKKTKRMRMVSIDEPDADLQGWFDQNFDEEGHWLDGAAGWHLSAPDALLEEDQLRLCVERQIERLPPEQRSVFRLRELEQWELADICNILDVSSSNVRVLLHRARLRLLRIVAHYQRTGECRNPQEDSSRVDPHAEMP